MKNVFVCEWIFELVGKEWSKINIKYIIYIYIKPTVEKKLFLKNK